MGSSISVIYACLFMRDLEENMQHGWNGTKPKKWIIYIDDIWFIWEGTEDELEDFHSFLNDFIVFQ